MNNIAMMANEPDQGAKKVGTYDIPDDRSRGVPPPPPPERRSGLGWLWWLLGILLLLALLAWAFQSCMPNTTPTATPTAAVAPAGAVDEDTATEAVATEAAAEGAAGAVDNTAVCTAFNDYDTVAAEAPVITAETTVADVRSYNDRLQAAGTAIGTAAGSVPDLDVSGFTGALGALGTAVTGLTGDVVGDAAEGLNTAFTGVTDAFGTFRTAVACD